MQPASPESTFFRAEGPHTPEIQGVDFGLGVVLDYANKPLRAFGVDVDGGRKELPAPVSQALLMHVGASLTPVHWLSFDVNMPFAVWEASDIPDGQQVPFAGESVKPGGSGVGDLRLGAHVRPIDTRDFGFFVGARYWAELGSVASYLSDKRLRFEVDAGVAGEKPKYLYGLSLGLSPSFFAARDGDRIALAAALHARLTPKVSIGIEPTVAVFWQVDKADNKSIDVLFEPMGALRVRVGPLSLGLAAGPGFGNAPGLAAFRGLLSVAYAGKGRPEKAPPSGPKDTDLDKIPDTEDACPTEAGPPNADPARNGCPSQDRDGDGIKDSEDACPDKPGVKSADAKANGCPDADNDEIPDPIDACPIEPGAAPSGCPKFARLQKDTFVVRPPLEFKGNEPKLSDQSRLALQEIAATMRANPKIEQVSVSLGTKGVAAAISDKRAQAIILVFQAGSLDSNRYEVVLSDEKAGTIAIRVVR